MLPYVNAGLLEPVTDLWVSEGLNDSLKFAAASMMIDGENGGVFSPSINGAFTIVRISSKKMGISPPKNWKEFVAAGKKLKAAGTTLITIRTKYLWTAAGVFDDINLRTNGCEFHSDLTDGKVPWTDKRVRATMNN